MCANGYEYSPLGHKWANWVIGMTLARRTKTKGIVGGVEIDFKEVSLGEGQEPEIETLRRRVKQQNKEIVALRLLLMAHRIGDQKIADKALRTLEDLKLEVS